MKNLVVNPVPKSALLSCMLLIAGLSACGDGNSADNPTANENSSFPASPELDYEVPTFDPKSVKSEDCTWPSSFLNKKDFAEKLKVADLPCAQKIAELHGIDFNAKIYDSFFQKDLGTPLEIALDSSSLFLAKSREKGAESTVAWLLEKGANPNLIGASQKTILEKALSEDALKYPEVVHYLIAHPKVDLSGADRPNTPLELAIQTKHEPYVSQLLDLKVDPNKRGPKSSESALMSALKMKLRASATKLIQKGASVNEKSSDGSAPLILAAELEDLSLIDLMLSKGADINIQDNNGENILHIAAKKGHSDLVTKAIKAKVSINATDTRGNSALLYAVLKDSENSVNSLLAAGANVQLLNSQGKSLAQLTTNQNVLEALASKGVNLSNVDTEGNSLLTIAVLRDDLEKINWLIQHQVDLNWKDQLGNSLLHLAAKENSLRALTQVLIAGLSPNLENQLGETPLFKISSVEALRLLKNAGANLEHIVQGNTALSKLIAKSAPNLVLEFISQGINLNGLEEFDRNYLHVLLQGAPVRNVDEASALLGKLELLIDHGVNVKTLSLEKDSALHLLAYRANFLSEYDQGTLAIEKLLKAASDPNLKNTAGESPKDILLSIYIKKTMERDREIYMAHGDVERIRKIKSYYSERTQRLSFQLKLMGFEVVPE